MKKTLLLSLFVILISFGANAQTPLTQAVDFDVTFTDGETFNLFDKLDEGKYVVIDFFFTTCGPCQINQPSYTETFQNFGCNTGAMFFLSVENTVGDELTIAYEETYAGENAPPAASGLDGGGVAVASAYGIGAFPTFILIGPDGTILEQDMWPLTNGAATFTAYFEGHGLELESCAVGIEEMTSNADFTIYPNPASSLTTIDLSGFNGQVTIRIFDILGKQLSSLQTTNETEMIDLSELNSGNYIVKVFSDNVEVTKRISVLK
jgi:thiol-disulfide isomerase/thioredoxin